ncbi:MAG TPA: hypothetical protein VHZ28_01425 [Terracidiphilus sp.]|nr:hypothetical protein [Terracidiphilus sp.]
MKVGAAIALTACAFTGALSTAAQSNDLGFPKTVEAGSAFSVQLPGSGQATLYILGPGQALKRDARLGETTSFAPGTLVNAGHYVAILSGSSAGTSEFDVVAGSKPSDLSFLAKPSRLPVSVREGISGAVYLFDSYHNLIASPVPVQFELTNPAGATETRATVARYGAAWAEFDSTPREGNAKFSASSGGVSSVRIVRQVPGDPCAIKMNATQAGQKLHLTTEPVRDCSGNAVPDGTIVTFTENYNGAESTVDVPLKRGVAEVQMPDHAGATISVASGVVMGNQIRWGK